MAYAFLAQQNKLTRLLGDANVSTDDMWPTADRKAELNRGELQFAKDARYLMEYATGSVSSSEISVPSDWLKTFVLIVNNYIITADREISIQDYERFYNYAGTPPYYYYWRFSGTRKIKFIGSVNGQTYNLYYFRRPTTDLDADADISIHDEEYREASAYYAAYSLLEQIGKTAMADRYKARYLEYVRDAQKFSEEHYLTKEYAHPDNNIIGGANTSDVQGGGILGGY